MAGFAPFRFLRRMRETDGRVTVNPVAAAVAISIDGREGNRRPQAAGDVPGSPIGDAPP